MTDPTFYLAMSYAGLAVAVAVEIVALRLARRRAERTVDEERELETQD